MQTNLCTIDDFGFQKRKCSCTADLCLYFHIGICSHDVAQLVFPIVKISLYLINKLTKSISYLLAASCTCGAACSTSNEENCSNSILTESEFPNGFSGSMTLLMNTLTTLSGLSWSGAGGPPISFSPSPLSKECWKHGRRMYWIICKKEINLHYENLPLRYREIF